MGGLSPTRSFNLERPSKLENRSVKPRWIFRVGKLTKHQATILSSMTSQKIQLREGVIIANRKDIILNLAHRQINKYTMEVARVRLLLDCHQKVLVIPNPKEALGEIDESRSHARLPVGVLTPIPLWLSLGRPGSMGLVHPKDDVQPSQPGWSPTQGVRRIWRSSRILVG